MYLVPILTLCYKQRKRLNANTDFNKTGVPLKRCDYTGVTFKYDIEISCM